MITTAPKLTDAGKGLLIRGISGEAITFTKFKIGNGDLSGRSVANLTDIINPMAEFGMKTIKADNTGFVELTGEFDSSDINSDFRWTEIGVFAKGEDGRELLYAYANDGDNAGMLKVNDTDVILEQSITIIVAIADAKNVTALVSPSVLYAGKDDFDNHAKDTSNPHKVTKEALGLSNVENVSVNDHAPTFDIPAETATQEILSGEKLSVLMGKIARAIMNLIVHIASKANPHNVTADQAGAAKKQHNHSASDINSGTLGLNRGGTGVTSIDALRKLLGSEVVMGTYRGDGTVKRSIDLGFKPRAVLLFPVTGGLCGLGYADDVYGGLCVGEYGVVTTDCTAVEHQTMWNDGHTAMLINDNGFWVSQNANSGIKTNISSFRYSYIAWK